MYLLRINTSHETLTYTFQETHTCKTGDDSLGISTFLAAFKKYYAYYSYPVTVTVMDDRGNFLHQKTNTFRVWNMREAIIPLNHLAVDVLMANIVLTADGKFYHTDDTALGDEGKLHHKDGAKPLGMTLTEAQQELMAAFT